VVLVAAKPAAPVAQPAQSTADPDDRQTQQLLARLSEMSDFIARNNHSPLVWSYHLAQAEVMMNLAGRSKPKERDEWLKMVVDSHYSAAALAPENEGTAYQRLVQLPVQITQSFPGSPLISYAALQVIRADHLRMLARSSDNPDKAVDHLRRSLLHFAEVYPRSAEAPQAIQEVAQLSEKMGKKEDARKCYAYLIKAYPGTALARKAEGTLWRMHGGGELVRLNLPLIYPTGVRTDEKLDLEELRGQFVVLYFWTSTSPHVAEDFQALRQVTDRYRSRGLEVVYVNLDRDPAAARTFLSGRLTAGIHVFQVGGLDSPVAERYGLQDLPQALLVARDGTLLKHSLKAVQLEAELSPRLPRGR
jgi:hypothetical protein